MVNGLPGKMATAVANRIPSYATLVDEEIDLMHDSLTGPEIVEDHFKVDNEHKSDVRLIKPDAREGMLLLG